MNGEKMDRREPSKNSWDKIAKQKSGASFFSAYRVNDYLRSQGPTPSTTYAQSSRILWKMVIFFTLVHIGGLYGLYLMFTSAMHKTTLYSIFLYVLSGLGVTAGAHRLWAHRTYKARLPLRIFLAFLFAMAFQLDIYHWVRDHRVHHKYTDTDADPHNALKGFFFSHVGWILCRRHPDNLKREAEIDMSDIMADPVARFQIKYYSPISIIGSLILPPLIPMYFWNETFVNSVFVAVFFRMCWVYNMTFLVNSAAHIWGIRPYDSRINPRENILVALGAIGEGFHNYHHTFPYDYATSEYGIKFNITTAFIDLMALVGLAYDRKTVSRGMIQARKCRTGEDSSKKDALLTPEGFKQD